MRGEPLVLVRTVSPRCFTVRRIGVDHLTLPHYCSLSIPRRNTRLHLIEGLLLADTTAGGQLPYN